MFWGFVAQLKLVSSYLFIHVKCLDLCSMVQVGACLVSQNGVILGKFASRSINDIIGYLAVWCETMLLTWTGGASINTFIIVQWFFLEVGDSNLHKACCTEKNNKGFNCMQQDRFLGNAHQSNMECLIIQKLLFITIFVLQ